MKLINYLSIIVCLLVGIDNLNAKVLIEKTSDNGSEMFQTREHFFEDTVPYVRAYDETLLKLRKQLAQLQEGERMAIYYTTPTSLDISKPLTLPGKSNTLSTIIGTASALKKMSNRPDRVITPEQSSFVNMIIGVMKEQNNFKDAEKVEKDLKKNKLSKKALPYVSAYLKKNQTDQKDIESLMRRLNNLKEKQGVMLCMKECFPNLSIESRMIGITDTVLNLGSRRAKFLMLLNDTKRSGIWYGVEREDEEAMREKWAWLYQEEKSREEIKESYPRSVVYYRYPSHPEYRVKGGDDLFKVYDKEGNLLAVSEFNVNLKNLLTYDDDFTKQIYAYAFKNNEYNIKNDDAHTLHYVKVCAGLEKLTPEEEKYSDKMAQQIADAFLGSMTAEAYYGKNSRQAQAAETKSAAQLLGAVAGGSKYYDSKGAGWIKQVEDNYKIILDTPYLQERVDDTTFRTIYVGKDGKGLFEVISTYITDKYPYFAKLVHKVNPIPEMRVFTQDEFDRFNELISKLE
ncbi:MAG: hypothetical protein K2H60_11755 [Muribaculaceae bacterium]|nr:hypothetical protein [Muribaculaceae bacterium]